MQTLATYGRNSEPSEIKLAAIEVAVSLISKHSPRSFTGRAAARFLGDVTNEVPALVFGLAEDADALRKLAELCRDVVREDPDNSHSWMLTLRKLKSAHDDLTNPKGWTVSPLQYATACHVLGVDDRTPIDVTFDNDGQLIARRIEPKAEYQVVIDRAGTVVT